MKKCFGMLLMFSLITACGPKVEDRSDSIIKEASTFAFLPNKDTIKSSRFNNLEVNELVIEEIAGNLREKDLRLDRNQPDYLLFYHLMLDEASAVNASPAYTNYSYYRPGYFVGPYYENYSYLNYYTIQRLAGQGIRQVEYKEGTLVIDVIDRRTNEIIWRGAATETINPKSVNQKLSLLVDSILQDFPN